MTWMSPCGPAAPAAPPGRKPLDLRGQLADQPVRLSQPYCQLSGRQSGQLLRRRDTRRSGHTWQRSPFRSAQSTIHPACRRSLASQPQSRPARRLRHLRPHRRASRAPRHLASADAQRCGSARGGVPPVHLTGGAQARFCPRGRSSRMSWSHERCSALRTGRAISTSRWSLPVFERDLNSSTTFGARNGMPSRLRVTSASGRLMRATRAISTLVRDYYRQHHDVTLGLNRPCLAFR
jgi:hypothetical protein